MTRKARAEKWLKKAGQFLLFSPLYIPARLAYAINSLFTERRKIPRFLKKGVDKKTRI